MFHSKKAHFVNGVTLNVRDLTTLRPFYESVLGFKVVTETTFSVQYEVGNSNHFITLNEIHNGREPLLSEAGLFYIGILLPSMKELADLLVQMSDYEIPVNGGEQSVCTSLFFEDPEGHAFKFYVDHETDDWMYVNNSLNMDIEALNVPRLLTEVSDEKWQGIPHDSKIGNLHLKTIRMTEVKNYYLNYFGLQPSAYLDKFSLYLASSHYHHHLALNQWLSSTKRMENENSYGLALINYYYPETTHININGPDGLQFRFNFIEVV
ncbi:VOC family protein [Staphylococcus devriesei]|uniref:VOC family protein n=1 Tax=Staphylococcus devriesei TaxID=586733 RepID=UPI000E69DBD4|nr:VOC family protein [Staphylococcus devriesei]RIL73037.1 VOC family protein [Staphylococcus devriesei]